jgi:hypothetical protein
MFFVKELGCGSSVDMHSFSEYFCILHKSSPSPMASTESS